MTVVLRPRKVAFVEPMNIGDLLCTVPLLRALRKVWPDSEFVLVGDEYVKAFFESVPRYLDRMVLIDDVAWAPRAALERIAETLRQEHFDVVLKLYFWLGIRPVTSYWDEHSTGDEPPSRIAADAYWQAHECSLEFAAMLGAPTTVGVAEPAAALPPGFRGVPFQRDAHVIDTMLSIATELGVATAGRDLEMPVTAGDREAADRLLNESGVDGPAMLIAMHPGASVQHRRWPVDRFTEVADRLVEDYRARILFTGTADEGDVTRAVSAGMRNRGRAVDLAGRTTLGSLAAIYDRVSLVVGNDTGAIHIAAARRARSVILFGLRSEAVQWCDPHPERQVALVTESTGEQLSHADAIARITVADVLAAARRLLAT